MQNKGVWSQATNLNEAKCICVFTNLDSVCIAVMKGSSMAKNEIISPDAAGKRELGPLIAPVTLSEQLDVIVHYRLFVAVVALSIAALGALYAYSKPSTYEANLLIQVDDMRSMEPKSLLGYASPGTGFKKAMSEVELLRSRAMVGAAADRLAMDISATPVRFPVVGPLIARWNTRRHAGTLPAYGGYAWSAEQVRLGFFDVPESLLGTRFVLTKTGTMRYRIDERESGASAAGRVGELQRIRVGDQLVQLRVDELAGALGARFAVVRNPRVETIDDLSSSLSVTELGKETGMIKVSLRHTDPRLAKSFLNELSHVYMDFVQGQRGKETRASLEVLSKQLPILKQRVELAEARYEAFRRQERAADLAEDTRLQLARYSETRSRLSELRQKRAELGTRLGDEHPELRALDEQIAGVSRDSSSAISDMRRLPGVSTELERRARDLKAETEIYGSVLRRLEEMRVDAQDRSSNVRVVDEAVVPVRPAESRMTILVFAAALGVGIGTAGAFFRRIRSTARRNTIYDVEEPEDHLPNRYAHARG